MLRVQAIERPKAAQHNGHLTYDLFHVWPDGEVRNGVRWASDVHAQVLPVDQESFRAKPYRIQVWVAGGDVGTEVEIPWGQEWWAPPRAWGNVSVVSVDDVPLLVFWELSAGKE